MRSALVVRVGFGVVFFCLAFLPRELCAAEDPIARFIGVVDSLSKAGEWSALAAYAKSDSILCGAAVGQILDAGVRFGDGGDAVAERERFSLAGRLAEAYRDATGSVAPLELVSTYRGWTSEQRATRARGKALEDESARVRKAGDLDAAVRLLEEAKARYLTLGDARSVAIVWGSLGVAHWSRSDWGAVRGSYENALVARRAIEDRILEGRTLNGLGSLNFQTGSFPAAVEWYGRAIALRRRTGDIAGLGTSLTYLGNAYMRLGRLVEARDRYDEAYRILESDGTAQQMVEVLNGSANASFEMGKIREASEAYRRAIEVSRVAGDRANELSSRLNLADALKAMGRYREGLAELDSADALLSPTPDPRLAAELRRNRGNIYFEMGELAQARDEYVAYVSMSGDLGDTRYHGEAFTSLGGLYRELGAFAQGLACADSARVIAERSGNAPLLLKALMLCADIEFAEGRQSLALENYRRVAEGAKKEGFELDARNAEVRMANVLAALGRREEARELFRSTDAAAHAMGVDLGWICQFGIADTYERENPDSACWYYERGMGLLERSRLEIGASETQAGTFAGDRRRLYEEIARYYASLEGISERGVWSERAFATVERGKARGLLDLLEQSVGIESSPAEEAVLDSLYRLSKDTPGYAARESRLRDRYSELRSTRVGESLKALGLGSGVVRLADLRRIIPRGTVVLEYALGDSVSLLWAVDRTGSTLLTLPGRSVLNDGVRRLCDAVARPGSGDAALLGAARNLYTTLIEPARDRLSGAKRLVIIPDGVLFELPFEALLTSDPRPGDDWRTQPFLTRIYATLYAPSASVLARIASGSSKRRYDLELLAMGAPDFSRLPRDAESVLRPLPFSRTEVEAISAHLDRARAEVFLGADASEGSLKAVVRDRTPRILHLATHGLVDPIEPANSCIVLCPSESPPEDGRLSSLEILSFPAAPDLAVVSACESARGLISRGEGVVGLSRSFLASGAHGVVASLWSVSDASTAELMGKFYDEMLGSRKPAMTALRTARLALIDTSQFAHPFYWSPFILIGTEKTPW